MKNVTTLFDISYMFIRLGDVLDFSVEQVIFLTQIHHSLSSGHHAGPSCQSNG